MLITLRVCSDEGRLHTFGFAGPLGKIVYWLWLTIYIKYDIDRKQGGVEHKNVKSERILTARNKLRLFGSPIIRRLPAADENT